MYKRQLLPWAKVAKRVGYLIDNQQFLRSADYSRMPDYERERIAGKVISFYARLPKEIERPFKEDFFNEEARKELPVMLNDSEQSQKLLQLSLIHISYRQRMEIPFIWLLTVPVLLKMYT